MKAATSGSSPSLACVAFKRCANTASLRQRRLSCNGGLSAPTGYKATAPLGRRSFSNVCVRGARTMMREMGSSAASCFPRARD